MADVGQAVFRAIADFSRIRREAKRTSRELEDLRDETRDADRALDDLAGQADDTGDEIHQLGEEAETAERKTRGWARQLVQAAARLTLLTSGVNRLHRAMRSPILVTYAARLRAVGRAAQSAYDDLSRFRRLVDSLHNRSGRLIGILAKLVAGLAAVSVATTALTAGAGGILSLVAAIGALSGALGMIPAGLALFSAGIATLVIGLQGFGDALGAIAEGDLEAFKEAVEGLAPSAREVAWALWELRPAFESIKRTVQGRLFAGMADHVRQLGAIYLPLLERTLGGVAGALNEAAHRTAQWLAEAAPIADIDRFLANIERTAWSLVPSAENLAAAFLDLGLVGSELMPQFADEFTRMTGRFRDFMRAARESGDLEEWIRNGVEQLKLLGSIAKSSGGILHSIFTAGADAGYSFLQTVDRGADRLNRFLASTEGQRGLERLFRAAAEAGEALAPVVEELFRTLSRVAPILSEMGIRIAPGLRDAIRGLGDAFEAAEPGLLRLADAVGRFLSALGDNGPLIGEIAEGVTNVLVPTLTALALILETLAGWFNSLPEPVQNVIGTLAGMVVAAGAVFFALGKLVSALKTAKQTWAALNLVVDAFRRKSKKVPTTVPGGGRPRDSKGRFLPGPVIPAPVVDTDDARRKGGAAGTAARRGFVAKFGQGLKRRLGGILNAALLGLAFFPGAIGKLGSKAKTLFTGGFSGTAPAATGIMGRVGAAVSGVGPKAAAAASKLGLLRLAFTATPWGLAINGLLLAGTLVWTHWDTVVAGVKSAWNGTVTFFQGLGPRIQTAWTAGTTWLANLPTSAQQTVDGMGAWFDKLPYRLGYAAGYAGSWVIGKIRDMKTRAVADTASLVLRAGEWFSKLPGRLGNAATTAGTWVKQRFADMRARAVADATALVLGAGDWFSKLPGRLGNAARSAGTNTKNAFRDMKTKAIADTAALGVRTVDIIRGLPGKIRGFVSGFFQAGADLAAGLWQGIKSAAGKVRDAAVDMVVGAIAGAKAAAREGSPSKVFRDIGINIGAGLAIGIERMRNRVLGVVTDLIGRLAAAFGHGGLGGLIGRQLANLPNVVRLSGRAGDPAEALHRPTAPSVGGLLAGALPNIGGQRFPDLDGQLAAALRSIAPRQAGQQDGRDVTANFTVFNPVPEPASDTAARKLRTLALMGAFG